MIREAIEYLADLAKKSQSPEVVEIECNESKTVIAFNGELQEFPHRPRPRKHRCFDLDSLGSWCGSEAANIWYGMDGIVVVLDDNYLRRSTCTMPLTPAAAWVAAIKGIRSVNQPLFIRWCLDSLGPEIEDAEPGFLQVIRQLQFSSGEQGHGDVQNGKESFGKSINAEVAGAKSFPDEINLRLLVWAELDIQVNLRMAFIVNPHEGNFTLKPLDSSIQAAKRDVLDQLGTLLIEHQGDSGLYCGSP